MQADVVTMQRCGRRGELSSSSCMFFFPHLSVGAFTHADRDHLAQFFELLIKLLIY